MARDNIPQMPTPGRPISADWGRELVRCLRSLRPVQGVGTMLSRTPNGTTVTAATAKSWSSPSNDLFPFKVRYHNHGKDKSGHDKGGGWEVYLPWGCSSVGATACIPKNEPAKNADGDSELGWYSFEIAENDSVETATVGNRIYRTFPVYALMKPWPHIKVSTAREDWEEEKWLAKKLIAYAQIAEWTTGGYVTRRARRVVQYFTGSWTEPNAIDPASLFALRYDPKGEASDPKTEWKAVLTNLTVTCGRFQVSTEEEFDIEPAAELVVLKINHATDGEYSLEVGDTEEESTDDATYVTLYRLKDGVVVEDSRTNITTMPFFDV